MWGVDKMLHIAAGCLIALVVSVFFGLGWGLGVGVAAGFLKESYDFVMNSWSEKHGKPDTHDVDIYDFIATVFGTAIGLAVGYAFGLR